MKHLRLVGVATAVLISLLAGFAYSQVGEQVITSLLSSDYFEVQGRTVTGAVSAPNLASYSGTHAAGGIAGVTDSAGAITPSARLMSTCNVTNTAGTSTANGASTNSWIAELYVEQNVSTTGAAVYQAATNAGNDTVYLADSAGNQILHTASTASAGASAYQLIPWTASPSTVIGPGTYYIVFQNNGTTNTVGTIPGPATCATIKRTSDTYGTFPTFTPPTTFVTNVGPIVSLY